ncbi:MAG: LacI family transcriptional regulator [Rhodothermia bacterium]|nr:LacI family transcriptional regulator [Rhodothermia bacterium]
MAKRPGSRRRTIKDVAAEANVAISTASLALNGKGYVSQDTRKRVLEAAKRLDYVPQPAARQLVTQETGNVGFVLRADHFTRSEPFYTRVFLGAEFEAEQHDRYVLLATIPEQYVPGEHSPRFLRQRNVDGILVAGKVAPAFLAEVEASGLPVVLIDFEKDHLPNVVVDNQAGARSAVDHLLGLGHQRISFVGADMEHPAVASRLDGYRLALSAAGLPSDPSLILAKSGGNPDRETGKQLGERLLALEPRPTAVFCVNDATALGVLDTAKKHDVSVPRSLSIIGFDDVTGAQTSIPSLTTVRVYKEQLGELALRYLAELMGGAEQHSDRYQRGFHDIKLPTELVVRNSTARREGDHE